MQKLNCPEEAKSPSNDAEKFCPIEDDDKNSSICYEDDSSSDEHESDQSSYDDDEDDDDDDQEESGSSSEDGMYEFDEASAMLRLTECVCGLLYFQCSCLHKAAERGDSKKISEVLNFNRSLIHLKNTYGETPIMLATNRRHIDAVKTLLKYGADPTECEPEFQQPALHNAAFDGSYDIVKLFLEVGCDIEAPSLHDWPPLIAAVAGDQPDIIQLLIDYGANVNGGKLFKDRPLTRCIINKRSIKTMETLLKNGAKITVEERLDNYLHESLEAPELLEVLLKYATKEEICAKGEYGETPFFRSCELEEDDSFELLLKAGSDIHVKGTSGTTPLHKSVEHGCLRKVSLIISKGDFVDEENWDKETPLYYASSGDYCNVGRGRNNKTYVEIAKILIEAGANVNHQSREMRTPFINAVNHDFMVFAEYLLERGATVHVTDNRGNTPLHYAVFQGYLKFVNQFVSQGLDINSRNHASQFPLDMLQFWDMECCQIFHTLLLHGAIYRRVNHSISLSNFTKDAEIAVPLLIVHGAAFCELTSDEILEKTSLKNSTWFKNLTPNTISCLLYQNSYLSSINGGLSILQEKKEKDVRELEIDLKISIVPTLFEIAVMKVRQNLVIATGAKSIWKSVMTLEVPYVLKSLILSANSHILTDTSGMHRQEKYIQNLMAMENVV